MTDTPAGPASISGTPNCVSNRWLYRLRRWPFLIRGVIRFLLWLRGKPVPYLFIENFEAGLDTRKSRFTAPAGSLRQCVNAHITRGKEIQKRRAFAESEVPFPSNFDGLHSIGRGLVAFADDAETAAFFPDGVGVERLTLTDDLQGVYDSENFSDGVYVITSLGTFKANTEHYYKGEKVTDWDTLSASTASTRQLVSRISRGLQRQGAFVSYSVGNVLYVDADYASAGFTVDAFVSAFSPSGGGPLPATEVVVGVDPTPAVAATASFDVTGGTADPGANQVASVRLDGYDLTGSGVDHTGNNDTTAQAVAAAINGGSLAYTASVSGATVTIEAPQELGAGANGRVLEVDVSGDVTVANVSNMAGGQDATAGVKSRWEVTFPDPVVLEDIYVVQVEEALAGGGSTLLAQSGLTGRSSGVPVTVRALGQKMYAVVGAQLYFSGFRGGYDGANQTPALPDPTAWINFDNQTDEYVIGAGVINLAEQVAFSEDAVGLGVYQGRLAVFSERSIQIWRMDPDPDLNVLEQVLLNIGAIAPQSIVEYGDEDIFFLSDTGIRSLRARDSSNSAATTDVGSPIDEELTQYMRTIPTNWVESAVAVVEPRDGRYLLAVGKRVYVFSNFPGSRVSAWSRYELEFTNADEVVSQWAVADGRLYYRTSRSRFFRYGDRDGETYDSSPVTVELPLLDAGNPAGHKTLRGIDLGIEGTWNVEIASEPNNPDARELIGTATESTYGSARRVPANAVSTHFSLLLTNEDEGPAVLANAIIHYDDIKAD